VFALLNELRERRFLLLILFDALGVVLVAGQDLLLHLLGEILAMHHGSGTAALARVHKHVGVLRGNAAKEERNTRMQTHTQTQISARDAQTAARQTLRIRRRG
jgi:Mg2+/Co2+ transporter CorC